MRTRRFSLSMQVFRNIFRPMTIGEPWPLPGRGTFHLMFSVADHLVGTAVSAEVPSPRGPRHWGQSSPKVTAEAQRRQRKEMSTHSRLIFIHSCTVAMLGRSVDLRHRHPDGATATEGSG